MIIKQSYFVSFFDRFQKRSFRKNDPLDLNFLKTLIFEEKKIVLGEYVNDR